MAYELAGDASKQVFQVYFFEQVAMGKFDMIALLIQSGIPVSISDGSKADDTPLHWACSFNSPEVAELLISNGADVNTVNNEGQSALHLACKNNNYEIIRMLLSEGADMNVIDDKGHLPINLLPTTSANDATSQKTKILFEKPPDITFFYRNIYLEKLKAELLERDRDESDSERLNDSTVVKDFSADDTVHRNSNLNSSPSRHNESTHVHGTGGMNDHTGYVNDEGVNYDDDDDNDDDNSLQHKDGPQLVIWPPTQKQCFHGAIPLVISSDVELPFYIGKSISDGDYNKLLVASELIDLLGKLGFQSRISRNPMIGKIRLNIDSNLVPGRHAYQLSIESEYVNLIASDISGLFYGLFGFVQLLQLHSEITVQKNVTTIYIPPVHISDHPEIQNRAVLWSFRGSARMQYPVIKEHILLMSKLRINMLLLSIDPVDDDNGDLEYALSTVPAEGTSVSASSNLIGLRPSQVLSENSNGGTSQIPAEEDTQVTHI